MVDPGAVLSRAAGSGQRAAGFFRLTLSFGLLLVLQARLAWGKILWSSGPVDPPPAPAGAQAESGAGLADDGPSRGGVVASLVTTCSSLMRMYPADAVNYFYRGRHHQVYYFAYLLLSPPSESSRRIVNEWIDPGGAVFCRKEITVQPQIPKDLVKSGDDSYAYVLFVNHVGLDEAVTAAGQSRPAAAVGQYAVRLSVDGRQTALTFFRVRENLPDSPAVPGKEDLRQILPEPFRSRDLE